MTRVRFAPSPTGFLHIGGVRTALFNWLHARQQGGEFLLRIENTDASREVAKASERIIDDMRWLGLNWDGPVSYQLDRAEEHRLAAHLLVDLGKAYERDGAIYLKIPEEGEVRWHDTVKGEMVFANRDIKNALRPRDDRSQPGDLVILRANGIAPYNFASPHDDAVDSITDVIRGDDHVSNTPKQIHVLRALGYEPPRYAHLPMVLNDQGQKMSKRLGAASVEELLARSDEPMVYLEEFRLAGYLPAALINHIALLGWSPGSEETVIPIDELLRRFRLEDVNASPGRFDYQRLEWLNGIYLRQLSLDEFTVLLSAFVSERSPSWDRTLVERTAPLVQEKVSTLCAYLPLTRFLFEEVRPGAGAEPQIARAALEALAALAEWDEQSIEARLRALPAELEIKPKQLYRSLYSAICGQPTGPSLFHSLPLLGRERVLARLEAAASNRPQLTANLIEFER